MTDASLRCKESCLATVVKEQSHSCDIRLGQCALVGEVGLEDSSHEEGRLTS